MKEFNYILANSEGEQDAPVITLPVLLNVGTHFEREDGTWHVAYIRKSPMGLYIVCRKICDTAWLMGHIEKTEYFTLNKLPAVNT